VAVANADVEVLGAELAVCLTSLQRVLRQRTRAAVGGPGLSAAEAQLLGLVAEQPGVRIGDAATSLRLAPNTVSTLVRRLSAVGFLSSARERTDRRAVCLHTSRAGAQRLRRWRDERARLLATAIAGLSEPEREALARSLPVLGAMAELLEEIGSQ
jgi:DNA-binding MarR family transcriptional regulator